MSKIYLKTILQLYEAQLCDRRFYYETADGQTVTISFYREQLCHLMGLQHVFGRDRRYLGKTGFEKIKRGALTAQKIKLHDRPAFDQIKERLLCFQELPMLMQCGDLIRFNADNTYPRTRIEADLLVFQEQQAHLLHLFLRKENAQSDQYAPVSFVVKSMTDRQARQFVARQK